MGANDEIEDTKQLDAQLDAEDALSDIYRRTMVLPASADFKPAPTTRKIWLKLILEKAQSLRLAQSNLFAVPRSPTEPHAPGLSNKRIRSRLRAIYP